LNTPTDHSSSGGEGRRPEGIEIEPIDFRSRKSRRPLRSRTWIKWVALCSAVCLVLVLGAGAWFVFTARQLVIRIEPVPDRVTIEGMMPTPRVFDHYLIHPGKYRLIAAKSCYATLESELIVTESTPQHIQLRMQELPGRISLGVQGPESVSRPLKEAHASIDGREVGSLPISGLPVAAGTRRVKIQAENYQPLETDIQVAGCNQLQGFEFTLLPAWAEISVETIPQKARVLIDGADVGQTPLTFDLVAGSYQIVITADGYKPWRSELTVAANDPQRLKDIRLEPADGRLSLISRPAGASVTLDESYVGRTPLEIDVSRGKEHVLQLSKAGYRTVRRSITVTGVTPKQLDVQLPAITGTVTLRVNPPDAELWIDGKLLGQVPERLELVSVEHRLEIRKTGYQPFTTRITPRPGFLQTLDVALKPAGDETAAEAESITAAGGYPMRLVRPAAFTMGASRREQGRRSNETLRKVSLVRPFYMGVHEVTNAEFQRFLTEHRSGLFKGLGLDGPGQPVVSVTWEQAALFCNWLSLRDSLPPVYVRSGGRLVADEAIGTGYRLPTEAEWEYCARYRKGGADLKYPWGSTFPPPDKAGNFADESAKDILATIITNYNDGFAVSAPPRQFQANALGLYDMGGNVSEWCHDFYDIYTYDATRVEIDPSGPREGKHHVVRGSSWKSASIGPLRLAFRDYSADQRQDLGFRICRYLKPK